MEDLQQEECQNTAISATAQSTPDTSPISSPPPQSDEDDIPLGPIDPMVDLFPENWRTISSSAYLYWESRARFLCPEHHRLFWPFMFGVRVTVTIHKRIREAGENLPPGEFQGLMEALADLENQLGIMQTDIVLGPMAANAYAEFLA